MSSLLTESYCNIIKTEGNLSPKSNIKKTMQVYLNDKIKSYIKTKVINYNYNFEEIKTDLLCSFLNSDYNMTLLEKRGYFPTKEENYSTEFFNNIEFYKKIDSISKSNIKEDIEINCEEKTKKLKYFTNDNVVCFFDENETKIEYYFQLKYYDIIDFKLDNSDFVYMIISKNKKNYLLITHLSLEFIELNNLETELNKEYIITMLEIEIPGVLEKLELNKVVLSNKYGLTEIRLCKKYYFLKDNKLFFNYNELLKDFKDKFIDSFIQINHLNMYNYLNFLGLNNFKINNDRKISSFENELFKNIFKNKFDNTLNGGLNYFNSKVYNILEGTYIKPDYLINIEDEYLSINGNFNYNFENGNFIIEIENNTCKLFKDTTTEKIFIKHIKIPLNPYQFYFCNLKFNLKKFQLPLYKLSYKIKVTTPYTFKIEKKENYPINKLYNNTKSNNSKMKKLNVKTNGFKNNVWFDGKSIIFENVYDFKNKKFLYNNITLNVKRNEYLDLEKYTKYYTYGNHFIKNNKIIFKEDCVISLTTKEFLSFELITKTNVITDFWFKNQGKTIYFKNTKDNIKITTDLNQADYSVNIPLIKEFISKLETESKILDVNEEIVKIKNSDDILITDKFFNKPLFNKSFLYNVKDITTFKLFNNEKIEIFEYITTIKNNILEIYFNAEDDKKYYCNYDNKEYIYLTIEKAQDDFKIQINIDENGEKKIERSKINKFSLNYNKILKVNEYINLFFYDTKQKESIKLTFDNSDINKEFEININCDYIIAESNFNINFNELNINIINLKSFIENEYIYFVKEYYGDLIYIANKKEPFKDEYIRNKLKINTKYKVKNNILTEDNYGNIILKSLQNNNIYIKNLNVTSFDITDTILYSVEKDYFYEKNFKTPGIIMSSNHTNKDTRIEKLNSDILIGGGNELL